MTTISRRRLASVVSRILAQPETYRTAFAALAQHYGYVASGDGVFKRRDAA